MLLTPADRRAGQPEVRLPRSPLMTTAGNPVELSSCPTPKCLTVVVAPWCGYCRASTEKLVELGSYLTARKITTRVVVTMDKPDALSEYAREFGPEAITDTSGLVSVRGVPHFIISDPEGRVLDTASGVPPDGIRDVVDFAARIGLP
jgi:thiol-disulfide isomerase/thioredoxin